MQYTAARSSSKVVPPFFTLEYFISSSEGWLLQFKILMDRTSLLMRFENIFLWCYAGEVLDFYFFCLINFAHFFFNALHINKSTLLIEFMQS